MRRKYPLKFRLLCLFFLGIFLVSSLLVSINSIKALDENSNSNDSNLEIEKRYLGNALRVYSKENFLYVFEENDVLSVYDLTKPKFPKLINSLSFVTKYHYLIRIEDDILYLPNQNPSVYPNNDYYPSYYVFDSFIEIYNLSDPYNVHRIGEFFVPGSIREIFIRENQAFIEHFIDYFNYTNEYDNGFYVQLTNLTLTVYNATNPENVAIIKNHDFLSTYGGLVAIEDNIAFYRNYSYSTPDTLYLVNFTDIYEPKPLGLIILENIRDVSVSGNLLFIQHFTGEYSDHESFINIYSIENPINPILLNTIEIEKSYSEIQTYQNVLLYESNKILTLYDISSPTNPIYLYKIEMDNYIRDYFISDEYVIIVNSDKSISIFYFTMSNPKFLRNYKIVFKFLGIGSIFIVIPLFHFIFERLNKKRDIEKEITEVLETKNIEKPEEEVKELFVLQPAKYAFNLLRAGFAIFAIQNAFMIIFAFIVFFSLFDNFREKVWLNYLFNILLFMDLIFAIIFAVALVLLYLMYKHNMALVIAILWLLWTSATFTYRFFMGLPEYYPQIVLDEDYSSYLSIGGLFAVNVILLWLCFYLFSKYLTGFGLYHDQTFIFYGYFNYILGFLMTFGFIWGNEFEYGSGWGIVFFIALLVKVLLLPLTGIGLGGSTASNIRNKLYKQEKKSRKQKPFI